MKHRSPKIQPEVVGIDASARQGVVIVPSNCATHTRIPGMLDNIIGSKFESAGVPAATTRSSLLEGLACPKACLHSIGGWKG